MADISCIIVSYNNAPYLTHAVTSVIEQTRPVSEIIIADDGSIDGSRENIIALAGRFPIIKPLLRESNLGVSTNRDLAIRAASSDLITTLDGDDWYTPNKIEKEYAAMANDPSTIAYSDTQLIDANDTVTKLLNISGFSMLDQERRLRWLTLRCGPIPRDMLLTKSAYLKAGGFSHDLRTHEDWDLKIRLAALPYRWVHSGVPGTSYRITETGLSRVRPISRACAQLTVLKKNRTILADNIGYRGVVAALFRVAARTGNALYNTRTNGP